MPSSDVLEDYLDLNLVIFSLPRSSSTYFSENIKVAFKDINFLGKVHKFNRILWIQKHTNVLLIVRKPEDVVKSALRMGVARYENRSLRLKEPQPVENYLISNVLDLLSQLDWLKTDRFKNLNFMAVDFYDIVRDLNTVNRKIYEKFKNLGEPIKVSPEDIKKRVTRIDKDLEATIYSSHLPVDGYIEDALVQNLMKSPKILAIIKSMYKIYKEADIKVAE